MEMLGAIGKLFLKDRWSSLYWLGADGNIWLEGRNNQGSEAEFRQMVKAGRIRFHPFTAGVESDKAGTSRRIMDWK